MTIRPVYTYDPPNGGPMLFGLTDEDYEKVRNGYACPRCLEDYNGVFLLTCPVCKHRALSDRDFVETPEFMVPSDPSLAFEPTESIDLKGF